MWIPGLWARVSFGIRTQPKRNKGAKGWWVGEKKRDVEAVTLKVQRATSEMNIVCLSTHANKKPANNRLPKSLSKTILLATRNVGLLQLLEVVQLALKLLKPIKTGKSPKQVPLCWSSALLMKTLSSSRITLQCWMEPNPTDLSWDSAEMQTLHKHL